MHVVDLYRGILNFGRLTWALDAASDSRQAVVIMILGSLPFTLYVATLRGHRRALLKDHQGRGFVGFLIIAWLAVGTWLACFWSDWRYSLYWH
jgi:Trk-type K+ transport system membrane component